MSDQPAPAQTVTLPVWVEALAHGWRAYVVATLLLLACALPGLVLLQPLDRDESRFAQATAQMFETGDFVRISFQDEPRNKKPVGIHWLQAIPVALAGGPDDRIIQLNRLVSLFGAMLAVWAAIWTGTRLHSAKMGFLAGCGLAISLILSTEAGIAKTDAMLAASVALAFMGLAALRGAEPKPWGGALFWGALACGIMIKGPVALIVVAPALLVLGVWEREARWMKPLLDWRWLVLAAVIMLPWYIAIWFATDGAFFRDAISQDLAPKLAGTSENDPVSPGAYLLASSLLIWPGSVVLGAAAWAAWTLRKQPQARFLIAWLIPGWLVFELAPAKLIHYTLPVHAPLIMLGAMGLLAGAWFRAWVRWVGGASVLIGGLVLAAAPLLLADEVDAESNVLPGILALAMLSMTLLAAWLSTRKTGPALASLALAAIVVSVAIKAIYLPAVPQLDISQRVSDALVAEGLHPRLSPATATGPRPPLIGAGYQEPSLIWLTRTDSTLMSVESAAAAAQSGSPIAVTETHRNQLTEALGRRGYSVRWLERSISGVNYSKGDEVTIELGVVVPAGQAAQVQP